MSRWPQDMLRKTWVIIFAGTSIGLLAASALNRVLECLVPVAPAALISILAVIVPLLIGVALCRACMPAHRAARVDPVVGLRYE